VRNIGKTCGYSVFWGSKKFCAEKRQRGGITEIADQVIFEIKSITENLRSRVRGKTLDGGKPLDTTCFSFNFENQPSI
jgi:hypothetical protein